jgi:type I restriction enzyme M protein
MAETCGHDRRGNIKEEDDIAEISSQFKQWADNNNFSFKNYGK